MGADLAVGVRFLGKGQLVSFTQLKIEQSCNSKKSKKEKTPKKPKKNPKTKTEFGKQKKEAR